MYLLNLSKEHIEARLNPSHLTDMACLFYYYLYTGISIIPFHAQQQQQQQTIILSLTIN